MKKTKKILLLCLVILGLLWGAFIISRSLKNGEESAMESGWVMELLSRFFGLFGASNPFSEHFVRKVGHFTEYAIFSALVGLPVLVHGNKWFPFVGVGASFFLALVDEFLIQRNTYGRGPSFRDVLIDTAGALLGALLIFGIFFIKERKKSSKTLDKDHSL